MIAVLNVKASVTQSCGIAGVSSLHFPTENVHNIVYNMFWNFCLVKVKDNNGQLSIIYQ